MCQTYQENKPTLMIDKYAGVEDKESIWYTSTTKAVRKHGTILSPTANRW
jgi:hypothetical protein